ncbi:MAG: hypothetical protein WC876_07640 [Candidatus Thermoplasmatota archaeon]|jgi:hypothetical protein
MRLLLTFATISALFLAGCSNGATSDSDGHDLGDMPAGHDHVDGMDHSNMTGSSQALPTQAGQDAFAAIQELVQLLEADPDTNWSQVDLQAVREHLVDMSRATLDAIVAQDDLTNGVSITVTGGPDAVASLRRMVPEHVAMTQGHLDWVITWHDDDAGGVLSITAPSPEVAHVQALGFFGWLATGAHHQEHHLALATGQPMH